MRIAKKAGASARAVLATTAIVVLAFVIAGCSDNAGSGDRGQL
ncbi:MAG: hypothetical protein NVV57_02730 [Demequina sp.]|nr:hypothetical protein [Demequina sp.]